MGRRLRRHGPRGTAELAWHYARTRVHLRDEHVWLELGLQGQRPRRELPESVRLRRAGEGDLALLEQLPTLSEGAARAWLRAGGELWLAAEGDRVAFVCWLFRDRTPVGSARGGWMEVPRPAVSLEGSVTSPHFRGRSIAPAVWSRLADGLAAEGVPALLTTIAADNAAVRRALEKVGFAEIARVHLRRTGPRVTVRVVASPGSDNGARLRAQLAR